MATPSAREKDQEEDDWNRDSEKPEKDWHLRPFLILLFAEADASACDGTRRAIICSAGATREIALDAGPLAAGRAVEHYEMSRYGALKAWATQLGMKDAAALLDQTPQEEKKTDALLSKLAQATVDKMAA